MGNASILKGGWPYDGMPPLQPPPSVQVLWRVFPLRDPFGEKYSLQGSLYCAKVGLMQWDRNVLTGKLLAMLVHPSGYPTLISLSDVEPQKMPRGGGMLLYGTNLATYSHGVVPVQQAWWCTVASVRPAGEPLDLPGDTIAP